MSEFLKIGHFKLGFSLTGKGTPVFVIGSRLFYERSFSKSLRNEFKFCFADHRGFVRPDGEPKTSDLELDRIVEDIEVLRQLVGFEKMVLVGHSAHGYMAMAYAAKYPDRISHLLVLCTGPSHGSHMRLAEERWSNLDAVDKKEQYVTEMQMAMASAQADPENAFVHFCVGMRARSWRDPNFDPGYLWKDVIVHMPAIDYLYGRVFVDIKIEDYIPRLKMPVGVWMGAFDYQVAPAESWEPYKTLFQNLDYKVFERSAHNPMIEEAELFNLEFMRFVKS